MKNLKNFNFFPSVKFSKLTEDSSKSEEETPVKCAAFCEYIPYNFQTYSSIIYHIDKTLLKICTT